MHHTPCQKQTFFIVYHDQLLANYTGPQVAKANRQYIEET